MSLNRFYVPPERINQGEAIIEGPEANHLARVLRLSPGEPVRVFDGQGNEFLSRIREINGSRVFVTLEAEPEKDLMVKREPALEVVLGQGLPKGDKMELIIQKGTELGVTRVIPMVTERTIVRLEPDRAAKRQQRWQKVAAEAARQSQRLLIPRVDLPTGFNEVLKALPNPETTLCLIPWEDESACFLKPVLRERADIPKSVWVFIGPEGGFSAAEIEQARAAGAIPVSLGPRILRTETAGFTVVTMLLYEWGDLGGAGGLKQW